jgi:hypothetical protein
LGSEQLLLQKIAFPTFQNFSGLSMCVVILK